MGNKLKKNRFETVIEDGIVYVPLSRGLFAKLDLEDYNNFNVGNYNWYARRVHYRGQYYLNFYAATTMDGKIIYLHSLLRGKGADHVDGDGLNNLSTNLRPATQSQNNANRNKSPNCTSKYKGVSKNKNKWQAQIKHNKKKHYLGRFEKESDAAICYDREACKIFGEYAKPNFVIHYDYEATGGFNKSSTSSTV